MFGDRKPRRETKLGAVVNVLIKYLSEYEHSAEEKLLRGKTFLEKLTHHKTRKHLSVIGVGVAMMATGSSIALHGVQIGELSGLPHLLIDMTAYLIHGVGAIPIVKHVEPVYDIFVGEEI